MRLGSAFGADRSGMRVHTDTEADQLSRPLDARAFTVGSDIFFRSDEQAKAASASRLLAHELTRIVQQSGGTARRAIPRVIGPHRSCRGRTVESRSRQGPSGCAGLRFC